MIETELKDLKESNEFLNLLLDNINSAILIADEKLQIHHFNDSFLNLFDHAACHAEYDYLSMKNSIDGFISEVFRANLLTDLDQQKLSPEDREHVTLFVRNHPKQFKMHFIDMRMTEFAQKISLTIDTNQDFQFCNHIANDLARAGKLAEFNFKTSDIIHIIKESEVLKRGQQA